VFDRPISQTTFYHYTLIHKGQDALRDFYMGWWIDGDLGNAADDYVGVDTTRRLGYFYNYLDFDAGLDGYGDRPPAVGLVLAEGIDASFDQRDNDRNGRADEPGERLPFTNFHYYNSDGNPLGNPTGTTIQPYYYMTSRWRDGVPVTESRTGYNPGDSSAVPTTFMYPGDPVTRSYWSEENTDGNGGRNTGADRRFVISSGPLDFAPGDTTDFVLAVVWAQGEDRLSSVVALRGVADIAKSAVGDLMTADPYACLGPPEPDAPHPDALGYYLLRQNYPEPFSQQTTIRYEVINTVPVQLNVYDLLGRRVRTLVDGMQDAGVYAVVFEAGDLPTGTYFYRLEAAGYVSITRRMVLQR
ncbi:MAG: T9SS type A sorting domain-containing protein, partial [Bacteroidota bacterium]